MSVRQINMLNNKLNTIDVGEYMSLLVNRLWNNNFQTYSFDLGVPFWVGSVHRAGMRWWDLGDDMKVSCEARTDVGRMLGRRGSTCKQVMTSHEEPEGHLRPFSLTVTCQKTATYIYIYKSYLIFWAKQKTATYVRLSLLYSDGTQGSWRLEA